MTDVRADVLKDCQVALPQWRELSTTDFEFADPKGFSTFTMAVRSTRDDIAPAGMMYRRLEGKENAILGGEAEKSVYLCLSDAGVAARCHHYEPRFRLEELYDGRTLTRHDLTDSVVLEGIGEQVAKLQQLEPAGLPNAGFFELLHAKWGPMAKRLLAEHRDHFEADEQAMWDELTELTSDATARAVQALIPEGPQGFCHNDTYHGNVFRLSDGRIRLLDFEFSCRNHRAFDFSNLFAETVMRHGLAEPPHFRIAAPEYTADHIGTLVEAYLDARGGAEAGERDLLVEQTLTMIPLSDYMYAMAALPLALEPIQKIRFVPYAWQRFRRFKAAVGLSR